MNNDAFRSCAAGPQLRLGCRDIDPAEPDASPFLIDFNAFPGALPLEDRVREAFVRRFSSPIAYLTPVERDESRGALAGTGFVVAPRLLLTAGHVTERWNPEARGAHASFYWQLGCWAKIAQFDRILESLWETTTSVSRYSHATTALVRPVMPLEGTASVFGGTVMANSPC